MNAYLSRLKIWVRKFNGVATRYLVNYLGWFRTLDRKSAANVLNHHSGWLWQWVAMLNHSIREQSQ